MEELAGAVVMKGEPLAYHVLKKDPDAPGFVENVEGLIRRTPSNPKLTQIAGIRRELNMLAPSAIPIEYLNWQPGPIMRKPSEISISPRFGNVLYMLVYLSQPNLVVEAGAGYGISGSYICTALAARRSGTLLSFESSSYAHMASQIFQRFWRSALAIQDRFEELPKYVSSTAYIDLLFVDAMHHGDVVSRQIRQTLGFCGKNCLIVVDDAFQMNRGSLLSELEALALDRRTSWAVTVGSRFFICAVR